MTTRFHFALAASFALAPAQGGPRAPGASNQGAPPHSALEASVEVPDAWIVRAFRDEAGTPIVGAAVWSSYRLGPESFALLDATTNERGEASVDLSALRELSPIERAVVELEAHIAREGVRTCGRLTKLRWLSSAPATVEESVLAAGRSFYGRVFDADGEPLGGARVQVGRWDPEEGWSEQLAASGGLDFTGPGGRFSFDWNGEAIRHLAVEHLRAGAVLLEVSSNDREPWTLPGLEVRLKPPVRFVTGTVRASEGSALGRPLLYAEPVEYGATPFGFVDELSVGIDGRFELACPVGGEWTLSTDYHDTAGFEPPALDLEVRLPGRYAVVQVVDSSGSAVRGPKPLVHALVPTEDGLRPDFLGHPIGLAGVLGGSWIYPSGSGGGAWTARLSRDGVYAIRGAVTGPATSWLGEQVFELAGGEVVTNVDLVLEEVQPTERLDVRLLDAQGQPIARWRGSLRSELSGIEWMPFSEVGRERSTGHGIEHEDLGWYAGRYGVVLEPYEDQFFLPVEGVFTLTVDGPNEFTFRSSGSGGRVRLVTDAPGQPSGPLPRMELTMEGVERSQSSIPLSRVRGQRTVLWTATPTGGDRQETLLLEPGRYRWRVLARNRELDSGAFEVRAGEVLEQSIDLGE